MGNDRFVSLCQTLVRVDSDCMYCEGRECIYVVCITHLESYKVLIYMYPDQLLFVSFTRCRTRAQRRGGAMMPCGQPRWLSGLRRSRVHSLMIAHRSLCPEKLGSNPGQGSKGINFSGWHGLDMSITVTKRR